MARASLGLSALVVALVVAGCDGTASQKSRLEGQQQAPTWPALQAFNGESGLPVVGMGMERQGPKAGKQAAATPQFKGLLDAFEKEPIPSKWATAAREAAKKDVVDSLRKLAEAGSDDEIKSLWDKAMAGMKTINAP